MKLFSYSARALAFIALIGLGACAGFGGDQSGVFNGSGPDAMRMVKFTKSDWDPRTGKNPMMYASYLAIQDLAIRLHIQIKWQTSSKGDACKSEGGPYLAAGALGGTTEMAFAPAAAPAVTTVTGVTYMLGGCINGLVTLSYDGDYAEGDSLEKAMRDLENDGQEYMVVVGKDKDGHDIKVSLFHNIHASASFADSMNRTDAPAPGLAAHMPDWHGAQVGGTTPPAH